jgi:hypothetical protein
VGGGAGGEGRRRRQKTEDTKRNRRDEEGVTGMSFDVIIYFFGSPEHRDIVIESLLW